MCTTALMGYPAGDYLSRRPNGLEICGAPCGEPPGQPRLVSRQWQTPGWPGSVEDPRPSGCFAKQSGGGSIELLGGSDKAVDIDNRRASKALNQVNCSL